MEAMRGRVMGGQMQPGQMQPGQIQPGQMQGGPAAGRTMPGGGMMAMAGAARSFPDHADQRVETLTARLDAARAIATAGRTLYAVLTDAQKKTADELLAMPMRGM